MPRFMLHVVRRKHLQIQSGKSLRADTSAHFA